ncbi:unnamed protein product [Arctogadus glacialis]
MVAVMGLISIILIGLLVKGQLNPRELLFARAVIFTVEEINTNSALLDGVTLGYRLYNGCGTESLVLEHLKLVDFTVLNGHKVSFDENGDNAAQLNPRELLFARAVIFTVEEINKNPTLLNGVTLGYRLYNGCGSQSLVDLASLGSKNILHGAMGFALPQSIIPGLLEFILSLKISDEPESVMIKAFWEGFFDCSFTPSNTTNLCTGDEDLRTITSAYTNTELRSVRNVYTAVYSIAHALNAILQCENGLNPTTGKHCVSKTDVQPKQVLEQLKLVDFTVLNGYKVYFDENGESVAQYDLLNWQYKDDDSVNVITIGHYDSSLPEGQRFRFTQNTTIVWALQSTEPPKSVCRDACPVGSRKAVNKQAPVCCFDCFECPEGGISNETDSTECFVCTVEYWPNEKKDKCIPKPTEFLSFTEIMGTIGPVCFATQLLGSPLSFVSLVFWGRL